MNERIAVLAAKASDTKTGWLDRQKFAELIIQECATIARNHTLTKSGVSTDYTGIVYVENAIKDHFGVKQ